MGTAITVIGELGLLVFSPTRFLMPVEIVEIEDNIKEFEERLPVVLYFSVTHI